MPLLAAVLGDPIDHSLSPLLHGEWLNRHGVSGHYVPIRVTAPDLPIALEMLARFGFVGANITVPLKEAALRLADEITETAARIGAANMLTFSRDRILADNTDAYGFTWNILSNYPDWKPGRALVLGAGGASRAVMAALIDCGAREILVSNRNQDRALGLSRDFGARVQPVAWDHRHDALKACDTLVNTTTLGMSGQPALDIRLDALPVDALVTDLIYTPLDTPLLAAARRRGNPTIDGLGMLLHQAVPAFRQWFGTTPNVDQALRQTVLRHT